MKWRAIFEGRTKGAIGWPQMWDVQVEGETKAHARLALYDTYEHIHGLQLRPLDPPGWNWENVP